MTFSHIGVKSKSLMSGFKTLVYACLCPHKSNGPWTYSKFAHFYSTLKKSLFLEMTNDINIDELKENCQMQKQESDVKMSLKARVNEELEKTYKKAIQNLCDKDAKTLKSLRQEHALLYAQGHAIPHPELMTYKYWLEAMTVKTMESRLVYYSTLLKLIEKHSFLTSIEKEGTRTKIHKADGSYNSIFLNLDINELEIKLGNYRLASAMQLGSPLVIDMAFPVGNLTELVPLGQQLWDLYCVNRLHSDPYHLVFTNCPETNEMYRYLELHHFVESPHILATFTEKCHLELFHHKKLVYLSPRAEMYVKTFYTDRIYILGAYHDPLLKKKSSYTRGQAQKILTLSLPIDQHVKWRSTLNKDLDLNHVANILLSVKKNNDWKTAFVSSVPDFVAEVL